MLNKYKALLLNDLLELYLQQKYNSNENNHVCLNYFIDKDLADDVDINYFHEIFEEVYLTKQEDEKFSLELFNLKESVLNKFDFCYENNLLDKEYSHMIDFVRRQEILLKKNLSLDFAQEKKLIFESNSMKCPDSYIKQLIIKYSLLNNKYGTPAISVFTPLIKWTKRIENHIISYFGCYFRDIRLYVVEVNKEKYIKVIKLYDLKGELRDGSVENILCLIQ